MKRKRAGGSAGLLIGYARVSTHEQNLDLQRDALKTAGCGKIFTDTVSGSVKTREGLERAMAALRAGDSLVVWKLDRLGRSLSNLVALINDLRDKGIGSRSLQENIDTTSGSASPCFNDICATLGIGRTTLYRYINAPPGRALQHTEVGE